MRMWVRVGVVTNDNVAATRINERHQKVIDSLSFPCVEQQRQQQQQMLKQTPPNAATQPSNPSHCSHSASLAQYPTHLAAAAATLVGSSSVSLFVCWLVGWFVGCLSGWLTGCVSARSPHQRQQQQKQKQQRQQQQAQLLPWRYGCDYVVAAALTPSSLDIVRWHYYIALPLWVASLQRAKNPESPPSSWQSKTTKHAS